MDPLQLPSIRAWADGFPDRPSVWDVASARGGLELAVVFSKLFSPDFIVAEGFVVLAERLDSESFATWVASARSSEEPVVWDNVALYDLFLNETETFDDTVWMDLARVLRMCWQTTLDRRFAEHQALVALTQNDIDYGPTLSIYQLPVSVMP